MARNIWLISDTHFGHENIIKYCNRPFSSATEMDEYLTEMWNQTVEDGDIVYHLGDVYFSNKSILKKLKGRKRLILGNHDNGKDQNLLSSFQKVSCWRMFPEFGLLLTHVPVHKTTLQRPKGSKLKNIHGHTHNNGEPDGDKVNYRSVCVELIDYRPINIEEVRMNGG